MPLFFANVGNEETDNFYVKCVQDSPISPHRDKDVHAFNVKNVLNKVTGNSNLQKHDGILMQNFELV